MSFPSKTAITPSSRALLQQQKAAALMTAVDKLSDDFCLGRITQSDFVKGMKSLGFDMPDIEGEIEMLLS